MTELSQNNNLLNFEEAKVAIEKSFSSAIGTLGLNTALLEKKLSDAQQLVQQMTASEAGLVEHIQDLEAEVARLRYQLSAIPKPLSPELAEKAGEAREVIDISGNEKGDP